MGNLDRIFLGIFWTAAALCALGPGTLLGAFVWLLTVLL